LEHFEAEWVKASPENVAECTAVGWFFADFLQRNMDVPVGIINASYGGSNIEAFCFFAEDNMASVDPSTGWQ